MRTVLAVTVRAFIAGLGWWVLSEGRADYAGAGAVVVLVTVGTSLWLAPARAGTVRQPRRPARPVARAGALVGLVAWYAVQILRGGIDVAGRLLRRRVAVAPVVVETRTRLPEGVTRPLAVAMYNLMPGSLVRDIDGDQVSLHSLDTALEPRRQWRALEERLARAAGLDLADPEPDPGAGRPRRDAG